MKFFNFFIFIILGALVAGIYFYYYRNPAMMVGERIPDIHSVTIDHKPFDLNQLEGKLVLIDFWGSWCGPCRKANPELSKLYREYKDTLHNNFEIVSIAIDDDTSAVRKAIATDSLVWPIQIMEAKSGGPATIDYKIKEIPASFLINERQQIIKVNPSIEELRAILHKFFEAHYSRIQKKESIQQ